MYDYNKVDEFMLRMERIVEESHPDDAFEIILSEINKCENVYLNDFIGPLNWLRHKNTLNWIEENSHRITKVANSWGHLAASCYFSWHKASQWLDKGRPLSLIALDALSLCTSRGERLNESPWMREIKPTLIDNPQLGTIAFKLQEYLKTDNVPRTRNIIEKIINDIFNV